MRTFRGCQHLIIQIVAAELYHMGTLDLADWWLENFPADGQWIESDDSIVKRSGRGRWLYVY